jgi:general secretion pathway protein K
MTKRGSQCGAALLLAMLTVALVATFAAASLWKQWRSVEVETAERARIQSGWILTGALDWARLLLREDQMGAGAGGADHLGEPWAVPLQEARLSSFLAADQNNTTTDFGPEVMEAFLSGQIIDLQSLLNVTDLVTNRGQVNPDDVEAFARLFEILGLPRSELDKMVENLRFAIASTVAPPSSPQAPLQPQRVSDLVWLGLSPQTVAVLEPYVTILPEPTPVNANTASAEVIAAAGGIDLAEAQRLVQVRAAQYFKSREAIMTNLQPGAPASPRLAVNSRLFEVRSLLRLDNLVVEERAGVQRDGATVKVLRRERGTVDPTEMNRLAISQR